MVIVQHGAVLAEIATPALDAKHVGAKVHRAAVLGVAGVHMVEVAEARHQHPSPDHGANPSARHIATATRACW